MGQRKRKFSKSDNTIDNRQRKTVSNRKKIRRHLFTILSLLLLMLLCAALYIYSISDNLIPLSVLENIIPALASSLYSQDGILIDKFYKVNRTNVPFHRIPEHVVEALISIEDRNFYYHWGVDLARVFKAAITDLIHFGKKPGASTLSMQLAKTCILPLINRGNVKYWKQ